MATMETETSGKINKLLSKASIPKKTAFQYAGNGFGIMPYPVRERESSMPFSTDYTSLIFVLQKIIEQHPSYVVALSSDIDIAMENGIYPADESTGTIVLLHNKDGYVDPIVEPRLKVKYPMIAMHGQSFKFGMVNDAPKLVVDESKLLQYRELPTNAMGDITYVRDWDSDIGLPVKFGNKGYSKFHDSKAWLYTLYREDVPGYNVIVIKRGLTFLASAGMFDVQLAQRVSDYKHFARLCTTENVASNQPRIILDGEDYQKINRVNGRLKSVDTGIIEELKAKLEKDKQERLEKALTNFKAAGQELNELLSQL